MACVAALTALAGACQRVPLLAPSGSTITLTTATNALPANSSAEIVAQLLEPAGTPPHPGTHVTFTTSLGTIEPADATTDINGRAIVRFIAGATNGTATISAASGGASTGANGGIRIAVGSAAVGRVVLSANPTTVSPQGGTSVITASVVDINGNNLPSVPVVFTTTAGTLGSTLVNTDANGTAQTTLATAVQAQVTATVGVTGGSTGTGTGGGTGTGAGAGAGGDTGAGTGGGSTSGQVSATVTVTVNPAPTVSIVGPTGTLTTGEPITFTVNITPAQNSTTQVRSANIDFGDGSRVQLGAVSGAALTVQNRYTTPGTFTVRLTVTDTLGFETTAATVIVVQAQPPLSVSVSITKTTSGADTLVTFTATVLPATATVLSYEWNFGDGTTRVTTSPQVVYSYPTASLPRPASVRVTTTTGLTTTTEVVVTP
jgi:hypothetical protein